jgi:spore coat protein U-like protein
MTRLSRIAAAALIAVASSAALADSQNMPVTANVNGACKLTSVGTMAFGTLDPAAAADVTTSADVSYRCTKGQAAGNFAVNSVTDGVAGTGGSIGNGTDTIAYTVNWTAPTAFTGAGFGSTAASKTVTLNGKILGTAYPNVSAGSYTGTIPVSILP